MSRLYILPQQMKKFFLTAIVCCIALIAFIIFSTTAKTAGKHISVPAQAPTLVIDQKSLTFLDNNPKDITLSLNPSQDMDDKKLTIDNENDIKNLASIAKSVSQDKKSLILKITPSGKTGSTPLKVSYKVNDTATVPGEAQLTFGYKSVVLKDSSQNTVTTLNLTIKEKKDLNLIIDPATNVEVADVELVFDSKILKVDKSVTGGQMKLSLEAVGVGEPSLKATIKKGLTYTLLEKVKVLDVLTGIILKDKDSNIKLSTTLKDKVAKGDISILEREEKNLELIGVFKSGKENILSWLKAPTLSSGSANVIRDSKEGQLQLLGGAASPMPNRIIYSVRADAPSEVVVDPSLDNLALDVIVSDADFFIDLSTFQSGNVLLPNGKVRILGKIVDEGNQPQGGEIKFSLKNGKRDDTWVELINEGTSATLSWRSPSPEEIRANYELRDPQAPLPGRPSEIVVIATAPHPRGGPRLENKIVIRMAEIKKFTQLKVKLNVMDERTASDLYGTVTANEYYVLIVRLFNDLKDEQSQQPTGNSIIAYSASMEIAVGLEKKFLKSSNSSFPRIVTEKDVNDANKQSALTLTAPSTTSPFAEELRNAQSNLDQAIKAASDAVSDYNRKAESYEDNPDDRNYDNAEAARVVANGALSRVEMTWERVYTLRENVARWQYALRARVRPEVGGPDVVFNDGKWHPVSRVDFSRLVPAVNGIPRFQSFSWSKKISPLPKPEDLKTALEDLPKTSSNSEDEPPCVGTITYRPLTFEMVVNTVDRRDARSLRSKIFRLLDFIGTGTSFVTSVAVPGNSSDLPLGLEKYRNLLIPGLDRLFPSLKEQNRQNIVSQTMKPIEEIPYGSDITRVIFIPKKPFRGLIRAHETRISEICPFFFKIEVAVIQNAGTVQSGNSVP